MRWRSEGNRLMHFTGCAMLLRCGGALAGLAGALCRRAALNRAFGSMCRFYAVGRGRSNALRSRSFSFLVIGVENERVGDVYEEQRSLPGCDANQHSKNGPDHHRQTIHDGLCKCSAAGLTARDGEEKKTHIASESIKAKLTTNRSAG